MVPTASSRFQKELTQLALDRVEPLGASGVGAPKRLSRMFPQRDHAMTGSVNRRRSNRAWAAHTNPSVTIGLRS